MQIINGVVVAQPNDTTVIVEVTRKTPHKLYKKLLKRSKKYKVEKGGKDLTIGQKVSIVKVRPISKDKHFKILEEKK